MATTTKFNCGECSNCDCQMTVGNILGVLAVCAYFGSMLVAWGTALWGFGSLFVEWANWTITAEYYSWCLETMNTILWWCLAVQVAFLGYCDWKATLFCFGLPLLIAMVVGSPFLTTLILALLTCFSVKLVE